MGVCAEIGHLSHIKSWGRRCIIDETKQPVSVSSIHSLDWKWGGRELEITTAAISVSMFNISTNEGQYGDVCIHSQISDFIVFACDYTTINNA